MQYSEKKKFCILANLILWLKKYFMIQSSDIFHVIITTGPCRKSTYLLQLPRNGFACMRAIRLLGKTFFQRTFIEIPIVQFAI